MNSMLHLLQSRDIGDVVVPSLPLLLLQLDRDAAHRRPLQPLHEMRDEAGDLVAKGLGGDQGDLKTNGDKVSSGSELYITYVLVVMDNLN